MARVADEHRGEEGLDKPKVSDGVDVKRELGHSVGDLEQRLARNNASVVDYNVDGADGGRNLLGERVDRVAVGDIAEVRVGETVESSNLVDHVDEALAVDVDEDNDGVLLGQVERHQPAEPAAATGNDRDLALDRLGRREPDQPLDDLVHHKQRKASLPPL